MPHPHIDWSELDRSLERDTLLSHEMLEILEQERKSLEERRYEQFEQLLGQKQQLIQDLEHGARNRRRWLAGLGFGNDTDALARVRQENPDVAGRWQAAAELWRECQRANQINEQICQRTRVVVERVLDLLRGQPGQGATYDAKGVPRHQEGGRTITNA